MVLSACLAPQDPTLSLREEIGAYEASVALGSQEAEVGEGMLRRTLDPTERCPLVLAIARAYGNRGQLAKALESFRRASVECRSQPLESAKALFELGVLVAKALRRPKAASEIFGLVVLKFPDEPAARRAAIWLRDIVREQEGSEASLRALLDLYLKVKGSDVAPYLAFLAAETLKEEECATSVTKAARTLRMRRLALYNVILKSYPKSALFDDAAFEAAKIALDISSPWTAIRLLEQILSRREKSWFFGSYETPIYAQASFLEALAREKVAKEPYEKAKGYLKFAKEFSEDGRAPEALFRAFTLLESSDKSKAREVFERLIEAYPGSEWTAKARKLVEEDNHEDLR